MGIIPWFCVSIILSWSKEIGRNGVVYIIFLGLLLSPISAWYLLYNIICIEGFLDSSLTISIIGIEINIITINQWNLNLELAYSIWQILCIILLTSVSYSIHAYTLWYAWADPYYTRFLSILSLFTGSMAIVFLSEDIILLFIGWELIGIASFLLISYYNYRIEAVRAGMKAIMYNRLGDLTFLFAIVLGLSIFYDSNLGLWSLLSIHFDNSTQKYIGFGILLSCWSKSAQFGLHPWLLDAMEGPTPVSALLHSATFDLDFKRVLAYSTCTHIALMIMSLGITGITYSSGSIGDLGHGALFHLFLHGWGKSLLFMLCGLILHQLHQQDIRSLGGVSRQIPLTFAFSSICLLAIQGCPGSYLSDSKDFLLEFGLCSISGSSFLWLLLSVLWLSQGYSLGILLHAWTDIYSSLPKSGISATPWIVIFPLFFLLFNVIFLPSFFLDFLSASALDTTERLGVLDPLGFLCLFGLVVGHLLTSSRSLSNNRDYIANTFCILRFSLNRFSFDKFLSSLLSFFSHFILFRLQPHLEFGFFMHFLSPLYSALVHSTTALLSEFNWSLFAYSSLLVLFFTSLF